MKRRFCSILMLLLVCFCASAQFYSSGDDPGRTRWSSMSSGHYRIIYPSGNDSLALRYGLELERWRLTLGASIGYTPNGMYRKPLPVVLHGYTAVANGAVTWAPRRMDFFTCPDAVSPEPTPWITELAVHESRHAAQMQFAKGRGFGLFNVFTGEIFTGAMAALYPGPALLEGDAVVAETALTRAGRGRSADFLEHYRVSFADGDFRDWYRWRWGSQKMYTPDHYRAGYMLVAGTRYLYEDPMFTRRYYDIILSAKLPLPFFALQKTLKQASGKGLKQTWMEIAEAQQALWAADEEARGPFGPARSLTPPRRRYTEYLSPEAAGEYVFAIQKGLTSATKLVRIRPDGKPDPVRPFAGGTEQIRWSGASGRLFWSETVRDHRWTLASSGRIFYLEPGKKRARPLTREGNLFNPSPSPDSPAVAVTEYSLDGRSAVLVLDGLDGTTTGRYPAPDSLQVVETAWTGGRLVASAISPSGFGLYDVTEGYGVLFSPEPARIKQLRSSDNGVIFVSDRNGVNELYRLGRDGTVFRLTNHRFGASEFLPDASGDSLTFAALTTSGRLLYREAAGKPFAVEDGTPVPRPIADRLSQQEASIATKPFEHRGNPFSDPRPYRKLPHLLRLHSWIPLYVDYDAVASASFETISSSAGLGATAFLQNDLGTASAIVGYSAARTVLEDSSRWNHSFHGQFTYRGWYPVIELSSDIGTRNARQFRNTTLINNRSRTTTVEGEDTDLPYYRLAAKVYVPLDFSRSGWQRGIVPRIEASFSNDMVNTTEVLQKLIWMIGDKPGVYRIAAGSVPGRNVPMSRLTASVRGYSVLATARSAIYPRWGIGAEAGISMRPGAVGMFSPSAFAFMYAYVPGVMDTHGIRLSALHQTRLDGRIPDNFAVTLPRGMTEVKDLSSFIQSRYGSQTHLTFDYAMPFLPLDWSGLCPVTYVRNFELAIHADGCLLGSLSNDSPGFLYSAGADLSVRLGNLLWIPSATRIGVSFNYNGSTIADALSSGDITIPATHFGLIFSVDLP